MNANRVKQQDVADALGVARSTVTKVLNHDPLYSVSQEVKNRIWAKAEEMGYVPRRRRSGNLAIVVADEMFTGHHELCLHACREAQSLSNRMLIVNTNKFPSYKELSLYVNPLSADGVILTGYLGVDVIGKFASLLPTVLLDEEPCTVSVDRIYGDWALLTGKLTAHLLNLGHTRIAIIVDSLEHITGWNSLSGMNSVLRDAGVEPDASLVWEKKTMPMSTLIRSILEHPAKPTALVACTYEEHLTILNLFDSMGVKVPGDISYVGWENAYFSGMAHFPDITCLDGYYASRAQAAVRRLIDRIENRFLPVEELRTDIGLHVGASAARLAIDRARSLELGPVRADWE